MIDKKVKIEVPADILANWQEITNILAKILRIPVALIMRFLDPHIEVFVSSKSEGNPYHPGDKEILFGSGMYCETVLKTQDKLLVPDALADANWENNPDVKLNMISYLGFPIFLPNRTPFGTICVLDDKLNEYSETTEKLMMQFRNLIESHLAMIYMNQILGDKNKRVTDYLIELQAFRGLVSICANCKSIRDDQDNWHPIEHYLIKNPIADFSHGICPKCKKLFYP
jgi:GAF domain-containing protein